MGFVSVETVPSPKLQETAPVVPVALNLSLWPLETENAEFCVSHATGVSVSPTTP